VRNFGDLFAFNSWSNVAILANVSSVAKM